MVNKTGYQPYLKRKGTIESNSNLISNRSKVLVTQAEDSAKTVVSWKNNKELSWSKYQIKETDMRIKTATFTSPQYLDLTTGKYCVLITSPYHECFAGNILKVKYDENANLYEYQCQDFSRNYIGKISLMGGNFYLHNYLVALLTLSGIQVTNAKKYKSYKQWKDVLSGLRDINFYHSKYWDNPVSFNPMKLKLNLKLEDVSHIEAIRSLIFGTGAYIDVYFNKYGVLQIEPFNKDEWLSSGLYLTTNEFASRTFDFDTTNIISSVIVQSPNKWEYGRDYTSSKLTNLNLSAFFGTNGASISNPNTETTRKKTIVKKKYDNNKEGSGINVFINTDNIVDKSTDSKMLKDIAKLLKKRGYGTEIGSIGPNAHYREANKVKKNGIYFTVYGGRCAGTLKEQATSNYYHNILKKKNARMVVGFLGKKLKDGWLPRAHDDNFSPASFTGWMNPRSGLLNAGVGIAEGKNVKELVASFPNFKTNNPNKGNVISTTTITKHVPIAVAKLIEKEKTEALPKMQDSIRDLLSLKVTLPLGNPYLKYLHTNMFLWTELPSEFSLKNFGVLSQIMEGSYTRYGGYVLNRWYVEGVTIDNEVGGKFQATIDLNPFASNHIKYKENYHKYLTAYSDAIDAKEKEKEKNKTTVTTTTNKVNTTKGTSDSNKTVIPNRTDGKGQCSDTYYLSTRSGSTNIKNLQNKSESKLAQSKIGRTNTKYYKFVKGCKTAKQVYKKLASRIPAVVAGYSNCKYRCADDAYNHPNNLNCAERARLFKCCCDVLDIACVIYHVENHYMNGVKINGKWQTADLCYRAGIRHKDYNSAGFNK